MSSDIFLISCNLMGAAAGSLLQCVAENILSRVIRCCMRAQAVPKTGNIRASSAAKNGMLRY